jgi:signal transduction histidine kinase
LFSFPFYSIFYFIAGLLLLTLAVIMWTRRPAKGILTFTLFLISVAEWSICAGLEAGAVALSTKTLIMKTEYLGMIGTGVLWLFFCLDYAEYSWWKRPRYFLPFFIIPVIGLLLVWTNELHGLVWARIYLTTTDLGIIAASDHGPLFMLNAIYQYCLYLSGIIIIFRHSFRQPPILRRQTLIILGGTLLPIVASVFYAIGLTPIKGLNMTPFWLFVAALIYAITVIRFRFLDILPVAYRTLVDSIPDSILILDNQNCLIKINPAAESLPAFQTNQQGKAMDRIWPELQAALTTAQDSRKAELTLLINDKPVYLGASQAVLKDNQGFPVGKLVIIRDITELKNTHKELEAEIQKRSQYSRALVHELRTPLASIIACTDMLGDIVAEPVQQSLSKNIRRAANNLDQRVAELYELARGEIGLIKVDLLPLDICLLVEEIVAEISPVAGQKGLSLIPDCREGLKVMGDKSRLRQVLSNLISNAIKFSEKGEIRVKLSSLDNVYSLIQVSDSGRGIAPDQMENLFDPYHRRTPAGQNGAGLGIGLALSKILIELHKGEIWAESAAGKGTTVSFKLPLIKE